MGKMGLGIVVNIGIIVITINIFSGGMVISGLSTGIIIYYNRIIYFLIYFKDGAIINMFLLSLSIKFVKNYTEKNNGVKL